MRLTNDIMEHPFYGPRIRKAREKEYQEGFQEGRREVAGNGPPPD